MLTPDELTIDPEFRSLLPAQSEEELSGLRLLIEREGYRDKIVVWLGHSIIVDGMTRWEIWDQFHRQCEDRQPEIVEKAFPDRAAVRKWIIQTQLGRRNLQAGQRAMLALELKGEVAADAQRRVKEGREGGLLNSAEAGRTVDKLAQVAGVSADSIQKAEMLDGSGNAEVIAAVKAGEMSLNAAVQQVKPPRAPKPDDAVSESDHQAKRIRGQITDKLQFVRKLWSSLQDDDRADVTQEVSELLGFMEGDKF